ncbi:hypothetical protein Bpfe_024049 [Biomphalaria pfeifferi]|uniref:Uncharacterized protein n=1 Tax=Biomphalaria pfeifferi TaxID=112525 RepID=A0AAD8B1Z4_BIOPF|nr:hypothetical protein Bpfe_024049 [Biomphalaria pfeifferi]
MILGGYLERVGLRRCDRLALSLVAVKVIARQKRLMCATVTLVLPEHCGNLCGGGSLVKELSSCHPSLSLLKAATRSSAIYRE